MSYRIEIKEGNVVEIFDNAAEHGLPFLRQPSWPDQSPWADTAEAQAWAEMFVEAIEVEDAPYAPNGPGQERQPKPTPEQIAEVEAQRLARENEARPTA